MFIRNQILISKDDELMHGVEGREGTYMAQSSAPLFLAKLPVGFMSGKLLQRYCPKHLGKGEVRGRLSR
jgi:hypothetical protein